MSRMPDGQTLKDRATQLLIKYKSGALVTQSSCKNVPLHRLRPSCFWKRSLTKQSFTSKLVLGANVEMNGWKYGEYESFVEVLFFDCEGLILLFDPERSSDNGAMHIYLIKFTDFC